MEFKIEKIFNNSTKVPITVGVGSFVAGIVVGAGVSYILERRKNRTMLTHEVPRRIFDASELFDKTVAGKPSVTEDEDGIEATAVPTKSFEDVIERTSVLTEELHDGDRIIPHPDEPEEEVALETRSIFAASDDEWNLEIEQKNRSSSAPYILHKDEFYQDELGYTQTTLTFYNSDEILADTDDKPVYSYDRMTGELKFGHGSGDPNVVYIRNDKLRAEYEVILDPGYFSVEVLGLTIEEEAEAKDFKHAHGIPRLARE